MQDSENAVTDFFASAEAFCSVLEGVVRSGQFDEATMQRSLAKLYSHGLLLPEVSSATEVMRRSVELRQKRIKLSKALEDVLRRNLFRVVFHPWHANEEPVWLSLSDALADIWYDLQIGLQGWQDPCKEVRLAALWHLRFSLETHWGRHATEVLYALQDAS